MSESRFIDLIRSRLGIVIHAHQSKELQKTIRSACERFGCSASEYLQMLTDCAADSPLLEYLVEGVTIGETYFFRDKNQMRLLQQELLPKIIERKRASRDLSLRIWSAGCSSGEEIYTIAMMLQELIPDQRDWNIHLLGSDINTPFLKKALKGSYKEWSMRSIDPLYKNRYFSQVAGEYQIDEALKKNVVFFYLNLHEDQYPSLTNGTNAQDLILCRNVLIYFDNEHIASLMKRLAFSLNEEGSLLLGASDPICLNGTPLRLQYQQNALFSRTTNALTIVAETPTPLASKTVKPKIVLPVRKPKPVLLPRTPPLDEENLHDLLQRGQWQELLDRSAFSQAGSSLILNARATALANLGRWGEAMQVCDQSLSIEKNNPQTHFLRAMILLERDEIKAAEAALRSTLFLDHRFVFAHFQLGLLLLRNKNKTAGLQSLKNALTIAKNEKPDEPVTAVYGLHYGRLVEILERELELNSQIGETIL